MYKDTIYNLFVQKRQHSSQPPYATTVREKFIKQSNQHNQTIPYSTAQNSW